MVFTDGIYFQIINVLPMCDKILFLSFLLPWCVWTELQGSRSIFQIWVAMADNAVS